MPHQLPADCLNDIFECLEDKATLRSCLLVNHLWCEVSVRFLWTNIQNYNTLISCLPNESKEILYKNEIIISTPTSKPPLFNYVTFIKTLSIFKMANNILKIHSSQGFDNDKYIIVAQEVFKMVMNQASLKNCDMNYYNLDPTYYLNIPFITYPGAIDCLRNLSELNIDSTLEWFYHQLSQICHNIQSLTIYSILE